MRPNLRSASGAVLMLAIIPILAGLLACMPEYVPLGNPERSRVDSALTGVWHARDGEDPFFGQVLYFQEWDKRTWMVTSIGIQLHPELDDMEYDLSTPEGLAGYLQDPGVDEDDFKLAVVRYKGWLAKVGGKPFLMLDWRGLLNDDDNVSPYAPFYWMDMRVDKVSDDEVKLYLIDPDFEPLSEAEETRRAWERVIRKHIDEPELYYEDALILRRASAETEDLIGELLVYAAVGESF